MEENKQGSALVWAIVVVMVIAVILAITLTMANTNYSRSVRQASLTQAEVTAQSTIKTLVTSLEKASDDELNAFIPDDYANPRKVSVSKPASLKGTIDSCSIAYTSKDDTDHITIRLSATYNKQTYQIKAYLYYDSSWKLDRYDGGDLS